jgi:hypothetical protein
MFRVILVSLLACVVLVGCETPLKPNQVRITYDSSPPGAMIYEGEKAWGIAPITLITTGNDTAIRQGYLDDWSMFAMWPSGAKAKSGIRIEFGRGDLEYTFSRPSDAPGLDKDLAYAAQLRQIKASEEQASAANSAAIWQMYNSMQPKSPTYTNCTKFGSSVSCTTR